MNSGEEEKVNEKRGELLLMGEKLKRVGGKREGNSTPSPTWKLGLIQFDGKTLIQDLNFSTKSNNNLSARKLGANLWEMQPLRRSNMADNFPSFSHHHHKDDEEDEEEYSPLNQLKNSVNSRKQNSPSLTRHNRRVEKVAQAQQPLSTASYCSSMEVAPHRPAISPNSSLPSTSKFGESSHSLKTSTELLKVLNRIWSLEEKHALDMSLVKTLRNELDQSHARIQELLQDKETELNKIDTLTKQVSEYKSELKLKRNSEKRHKKLTTELLEIKSLFSNALTELEQERKARTLIEDLCDEFAKGIREYEQELRLTKHKFSKDKIPRKGNDRLVLHISEAWLDERAQMKLAGTQNVLEKQSSFDKLIVEIEAFLRVKQSSKSDILSRSLESIHLNEPASAPWKGNEDDDSASISHHRAQFRHANETGLSENEESPATKKSRMENSYGAKSLQRFYRNRISDADVELKDARVRNRALESEDKRVRIWESNCPEGSFDAGVFAGPPSPVRKWTDHEICVSSSPGWQKSMKADTLKAKLMEARQQSRARISKG
ncbi:hypothetical protein ABFX02_02G171400 [Erythranthe guttata]